VAEAFMNAGGITEDDNSVMGITNIWGVGLIRAMVNEVISTGMDQ
jgi:hypothetical protein